MTMTLWILVASLSTGMPMPDGKTATFRRDAALGHYDDRDHCEDLAVWMNRWSGSPSDVVTTFRCVPVTAALPEFDTKASITVSPLAPMESTRIPARPLDCWREWPVCVPVEPPAPADDGQLCREPGEVNRWITGIPRRMCTPAEMANRIGKWTKP